MSDNVNIVLVEMQKLKNMIESYISWYAKHAEIYSNSGCSTFECNNERVVQNTNVVVVQPKNRREYMLLGVHQTEAPKNENGLR
jgi:hypothetical protein